MTLRIAPNALIEIVREWRSLILVVMLASLLVVLQQPTGSNLARALFMAHLGLFIVWQPFVESGQRLGTGALAIVAAVIFGATMMLDPRLLLLWVMVLAGIVGGKVPLSSERTTRFFYLLALTFLVLMLLLLAIPASFHQVVLPAPLRALASLGLPLLLLLMAILPRGRDPGHAAEVVDFINSVFIFLLLAVIVLGSLSMMLLLQKVYAEALLITLILLGCVLLILGWTWNPHAGFSGFGGFVSRYLISIGLPMERWLQVLASRVLGEEDPDAFTAAVVGDLAGDLPWVEGIEWTAGSQSGAVGKLQGYTREIGYQDVTVILHTRYPLSPALVWHFNLLIQLLGEFRADKLRAKRLKEISYLQAVHETGARLTHDVKNLLQSLQVLCAAAEAAEAENSPQFRALLRRQLPQIASRLGATLTKLRAPREALESATVGAAAWWSGARQRHAGQPWIRFATHAVPEDLMIPSVPFTSALENLLGNAEEKRSRQPDLKVQVTIGRKGDGAWLLVQDDGSPVEPKIAEQLTKAPVSSENGLGIGLFQTARLAEQAGYHLALADNRARSVCFLLEPA